MPPIAPLPGWAAALPTPFRAVLDFFIFSFFFVDDEASTKLRKLVVGIMGLAAPQVMLLGLHNILNPEGGLSLAHILAGICYGGAGVMLACAFALGKMRPQHTITAATIGLCAIGLTPFIVNLTNMAIPVWGNHTAVALAALTADIPATKGIIALSAVGFLLSAYNQAWLAPSVPNDGPLLSIPDPMYELTFYRRFTSLLAVFSNLAIVTIGVWIQREEGKRLTTEADASAHLASELADSLAQYDTGRATRQLDAAREAGVARTQLVDRLSVIVTNMDRYRPHLPNWVIDAGGLDADDSDDEEELDGDTSAKAGSTLLQASSGHQSTNSLRSASGGRSPLIGDRSVGERWDGAPRSVAVVVAEVTFRLGGNDVWEFGAQEGHAFVDQVHEVAGQTAGAVHSFIGDTVTLTWNAVSAVVQAEAKAATFLARLRCWAGSAGIPVWGGAAGVIARVQLAGHQQRAVVASIRDARWLREAVALGQQHGWLVVEEAIHIGGQHAVEFVGVGVAWPTTPKRDPEPHDDEVADYSTRSEGRRGRGLYAVAREHGEAAGNEEWLYVVEQRAAGSPRAALCNAVLHLSRGETQKALEALPSRGDGPPFVTITVDQESQQVEGEEVRVQRMITAEGVQLLAGGCDLHVRSVRAEVPLPSSPSA